MKRIPLSQQNGFLEVTPNYEELSLRATQLFIESAKSTLTTEPVFSAILSGSHTPKRLYELLGQSPFREQVPWEKVHFFWGDERDYQPDHPASNFRVAQEALLSHIQIPTENIHRIKPDLGSATAAAEEYEQEIKNFFSNYFPGKEFHFDLAFMGLGDDGHTASLFPENSFPSNTNQLVFAPWVSHLDSFRISLTPQAFAYCKRIIFLVSGDTKVTILKNVLQGTEKVRPYPAELVRPKNGEILWLVDQSAASQLALDGKTAHAA
jgi:6-phosphogluconolactonase